MILFLKSILKELNPLQNIKILHTNVRNDILAGITVAIIALPLALAFGEISQLGPVAGIWSAVVGGVVGGLFGGCFVGVSGPTAPMASQIAVFMGAFIIGTTNNPDLIAAFSIIFLSGLILVGFSFLKISRFVHYIPYSVIAGFMCGIGVIVILSQINPFLGLEAKRNTHEVFNNLSDTIQNINFEVLYVSLPSLLIVCSWPVLVKRSSYLSFIPAPLIALILGTSIAYFMNLNIPYIGDKMDISEHAVFSFYLPDLSRIGEFIGPACVLACLAVLDSLLSCKVADNITGAQHSSDRETFGQGMANMVAGLMGGISTATATTQTVGNITFGAKTPLATIVKGLTLLAVLLGLGFLVAAIPNACLAAILFKLGIDILDYRIIPVLRRIPKIDLFIFVVVLFITVYKDLMIAVAVGFLIATIKFIKQIIKINSNSNHQISSLGNSNFALKDKRKQDIIDLPVNVLQPKGPLFFGSIQNLIKKYNSFPKQEILIIDMNYITMIDLSGIFAIEDLIKKAKINNIKVFVSNARDNIKTILKKMDFIKYIGEDNYKDSNDLVIDALLNYYNENNNVM